MITTHQAYRYCRLATRRKAKNFYYSFIFLSRRKRYALYAVYTFCHSADAIADGVLSLEQKLNFLTEYRENIKKIQNGEIIDDALFVALADTIRRFKIPHHYFETLIDGVMMDLGVDGFANFEELKNYCHKVSSVVGLMVIEILGYSDETAKKFAEDLGLAMQLTNILRDLREDADRRRFYIPQDEMQKFGYTKDELSRSEINRAFENLMAFQVARAKGYFSRSKSLLRYLDRRSRYCPAMVSALYQKILSKIESAKYDVFGNRMKLSLREKYGLALKTFLKILFLPPPSK